MRRPLLAAGLVALGCGDPDVGVARQPIVGGVGDPGHADVVGVGLARSGAFCSGTLISPHVVVTAGHCGLDIDAVFFDLGGPRQRVIPVDRVVRHPEFFTPTDIDPFVAQHDVTLLHVTEDVPTQPAPLLRETLGNTPEFIGPAFTFVGYGVVSGVTGAGFGTRRAVSLPIQLVGPGSVGGSLGTINETLFYFQASGKNSCNGDSGGPAFLVRDRVERHAGVTSSGDARCQTDGDVGRTDAPEIAGFLQPTLDALEGGDPCRADGICNESCNLRGELVDPDCADRHCAPDGVCALACVAPVDPDCAGLGIDHCIPDGVCDPSCAVLDPDCAPLCGQEGTCIPGCPAPDPDCQGFCGDGIIQPGEQCDDGNTIDGDGCDASCRKEAPPGGCAVASGSGARGELVAGLAALLGWLWLRRARAHDPG